MTNIRANVQVHSRKYAAASLILTSILAAMVITSESNRTVSIWSARHALIGGQTITSADVMSTKVLLPTNSTHYLSTSAAIIGTYVLRPIGTGELIPAAALSRNSTIAHLRQVPLAVARNDLPSDLMQGQSVNLYSLPIKNQGSTPTSVSEIAHGVSVAGIDSASKTLGGAIGVVVSLPDDAIPVVLNAAALNRLVIVRNG